MSLVGRAVRMGQVREAYRILVRKSEINVPYERYKLG